MRRITFCLLAVLFAAPALAQTNGTYLLTSSNTVSPSSPTTTIEVWASWVDPVALFVFGGGDYDLTASDGEFVSGTLVLGSEPPNILGVINGNVISGALIGQVSFCTFTTCPLTDNPILLATYDWTTTDFTPRAVSLDTSNSTLFIVADPNTIKYANLYPNEFTPGSGVINVVPAPAVWLALALPLVVARRRRRC